MKATTSDTPANRSPDLEPVLDGDADTDRGVPFIIETSPATIEPGAEIVMTAFVAPEHAQALFHATVLFRDAEGAPIGRAPLTDARGGALRSEPVERVAPDAPGSHAFSAVMEGPGGEVLGKQDFCVAIAAHPIALTLWDVPHAVEQGAGFQVTLGIKCPCGCMAEGWAFRITDSAGQIVAEGQTGHDPWPGTSGLYHATVALVAPDSLGAQDWTVTALVPDHPTPHIQRSLPLHLNVQPAPEVTLKVLAVDAETGAPVPRARVVVHPYRTFTDAQGRAEVRLPRGRFTIFVSGPPYFAFKTTGEVKDDMSLTAEMYVDREFTDADAWA